MLAQTMASPITMSWYCTICMPCSRSVVLNSMRGSVRLGVCGPLGGCGAVPAAGWGNRLVRTGCIYCSVSRLLGAWRWRVPLGACFWLVACGYGRAVLNYRGRAHPIRLPRPSREALGQLGTVASWPATRSHSSKPRPFYEEITRLVHRTAAGRIRPGPGTPVMLGLDTPRSGHSSCRPRDLVCSWFAHSSAAGGNR